MKKVGGFLALVCMVLAIFHVAHAQMIGGTPPALAPVEDPGCARASIWEGVGWTGCGLSKGIFAYSHTDLVEPGPMPITLRRTYRSNAGPSVGFGPGWNFDYGIYLYSESEAAGQGFLNVDVVMPDGARVFCKSDQRHRLHQFDLSMYRYSGFGVVRSHDYLRFGSPRIRPGEEGSNGLQVRYNAPLQSVTDWNGNSITLVRSGGQTGNITQILGSNGRYINFTYTNGLITQATDALTLQYGVSRTISYGDHGSGRLVTITIQTIRRPPSATARFRARSTTSLRSRTRTSTRRRLDTRRPVAPANLRSDLSLRLDCLTARRGDFLIRRIPTATSPAPTSPTVLAPSATNPFF